MNFMQMKPAAAAFSHLSVVPRTVLEQSMLRRVNEFVFTVGGLEQASTAAAFMKAIEAGPHLSAEGYRVTSTGDTAPTLSGLLGEPRWAPMVTRADDGSVKISQRYERGVYDLTFSLRGEVTENGPVTGAPREAFNYLPVLLSMRPSPLTP